MYYIKSAFHKRMFSIVLILCEQDWPHGQYKLYWKEKNKHLSLRFMDRTNVDTFQTHLLKLITKANTTSRQKIERILGYAAQNLLFNHP